MKTRLLICLMLLCNSLFTYSQNWNWSKKISGLDPQLTGGLFTSNQNNVYSYSANVPYYSVNPLTDTIGSTLQCYSADGDLLFTKRWAQSFYITKMSYDKNNAIYFSAVFFGSQNINGITIVSEGESDGAIGKMDLNGNILWISTFGGTGTDRCFGICYNPADQHIYVTGSIKNSLYFNHSFVSSGQQSGIICVYNSNGNLSQHKLYDYVPERDSWEMNVGREIACNINGEVYVLMERDGKHWNYNDTVTAPTMGRYVMKINFSLDTLWSKYIIGPECYYGYRCNSLAVANNGDAYIASRCSHKYGGDAFIKRLNSVNGQLTWSYPNNDGNYKDLFPDGDKLYVIGQEGANGCPCPENTEGYNIVKIFDENNLLIGETRAKAYFSYITLNDNKEIYVSGTFRNRSCSLGPDIIIADSSLYSGTYYDYNGKFLSKFENINCTVPVITVGASSVYGHFYSLCPDDSALLTTNCNSGSFFWSNSATTSTTFAAATGLFSVMNNQPNGCNAYSLPVSLIVNTNERPHAICMVTYDSVSGRNKIFLKEDGYRQLNHITEINIYKKSAENNILLGTETSLYRGFIDSLTQPSVEPAVYFLKTKDSCGTVSQMSAEHTSMLLTATRNNSGRTMLSWNHYSGIPVTKYYIRKGMNSHEMILYDSVPKFETSYEDIDTSGSYNYQIEAKTANYGCYSTGGICRNIRSNFAFPVILNLDNIIASGNYGLEISPNPAQNSFIINCKASQPCNLTLRIYNTLGEIVYYDAIKNFQGEYNKLVNISLSKGIYFLGAEFGNELDNRKIVIQ